MNSRRSGFRDYSILLAIAGTILLTPSVTSAKEHKAKVSENSAHVVAHLTFNGMPLIGMAIQKRLTIRTTSTSSIPENVAYRSWMSGAEQPKVIAVKPWPDTALSNRMTLTGDLAVIDEIELGAAQGSSPSNELVLWDVSNPAAPREVQKFTGVVKWLEDERNFIYVLKRGRTLDNLRTNGSPG